MRATLTLPILIALAACGDAPSEDPLAALERELAADAGDPAVVVALADPITTDPMLSARANTNSVRPPSGPFTAPIPASDVAARGNTADLIAREKLEAAPAATGEGCSDCANAREALTLATLAAPIAGQCGAQLGYSNGWATRLSDAVPLIPNARVIEAAGASSQRCDLRVVRFWSDLPPDTLTDWYFTRAKAARYASDRQADTVGQRLAGRHPDGQRYALFVDPRDGGGSDVALVVRAR
ncbi:hypothetical protein [Sphingomonas sp. AX6]|uniref:hypothetical protein n=1 Tax=Sphingomonas sp. AX6 TaxID=2653171 RepID=UPI0012EF202B|nr:hypothetical protein [Sphingomonas sp. AX6]VXD00583.1 conserved hypothetical protein [Sphingomonas sp. AX6]